MSSALSLRRLLVRVAIIAAIVLVLLYGLFEARRLIEGPRISITEPQDGASIGGPEITIEGSAQNAAFLTINGKEAFVDQDNNFQETLSPPPGYTVVTVSAKDRFGRVATRSVHIIINTLCSAYAEG